MVKITLVFVLTFVSTSYLQEVSNPLPDQPLLTNDPTSPLWSLQNNAIRRRKAKPCPRRSNRADEPLIPSFSSKVTHPLNEPAILQPQALKNDDYQNSIIPKDNGRDNFRRSYGSYDATLNPVQPFNADDFDYDCVDQLDATKGDEEETALKIIEDCLRKKQKNKVEQTLLGSGRRSMPNDGEDNEDSEGGPLFGTISDVPTVGRQGVPLNDGIAKDDSESRRKSKTKSDSEISTKTSPLRQSQLSQGQSQPSQGQSQPPSGQSLGMTRICYACSTATNPSCWNPNQRTTIKYCAQEQSCVTKTLGNKNSPTLIRDCANSCKDSSIPGLEPKYKSCKLCHSDYCNSAVSINGYNLAIVLVVAIVKCTYHVI